MNPDADSSKDVLNKKETAKTRLFEKASAMVMRRCKYWSFLCNRDLWALGLILVVPLVFFRELIFDGKIIWGADIEYFFYPTRVALADALKSGDVRSILWTPYVFGGYPLFAEGQIGALYPLNWLFGLPFLPPLVIYSILTVLHYFLAGAFMYAYARVIKMRRAGALVAAIGFAFCGFMISHIYHMSLMNAAVWLPLLFLFTERFLTTGRWYSLIWASLTLATMIFAGHPQIALESILALGGYILFRVLFGADVQWDKYGFTIISRMVSKRRSWTGSWASISKLVWAFSIFSLIVAIGVLVASAQLVPLFELTNASVRTGAAVSDKMATSFSLPIKHLLTLIFPFYFGDLGSYRGAWNFAELALYIGVLPLALALVSLFQKPNCYTALFFLMGAVCLMLALGDATPLFEFLHRLPIYSGLRAPARFVLFVDLAIAVLAGFGLGNLYSTSESGKKRLFFSVVLLVALSGILFWTQVGSEWFAQRSVATVLDPVENVKLLTTNPAHKTFLPLIMCSRKPWILGFVSSIWSRLRSYYRSSPYLFMLVSITVLALGSRKRLINGVHAMCIVLVVVDLFMFAERLNGHFLADFQSLRDGLGVNEQMVDFLQAQRGFQRIYNIRRHPSNAFLPLEVSSLDGYTPLILDRHRDYEEVLAESDVFLLSLASVRYVVDHVNQFSDVAKQNDSPLVYDMRGAKIYENVDALPRAFVVFDAVIADKEPLALLRRGEIDPTETVVLEKAFDISQLSGPGEATVDITNDAATHVALHTSSSHGGFLVFHDTYYPGWKAFVDGEEHEIYRANYLFRAVLLPPGEHTVEFVYHPLSLCLGATISSLTLICIAGYLIKTGAHTYVGKLIRRAKGKT